MSNDEPDKLSIANADGERYRALLDRMDEGFCIIEMLFDGEKPVDYRFLEVNPAFERHTGIVDAQGRLMRDIAPEYEQHWFEQYGEIALTGQPRRFEAPARALGNRWYDLNAFPVGHPQQRRVAILFSDITERRRIEQSLQESEARFRQFSEASTNVLWIRNAATLRMEFASPAFERLYGRPCDPASGGESGVRCWARLIVPEDRKRVLGNFRRVRAGERVDQEFRIRRADTGELRWMHNADFPLLDANGRVQWLAGIGMDITSGRDATERQSVLVAELQHRTRNLIGIIRSLADRTADDAVSLDAFRNRFGERLAALSRVQGMLSQLAAGAKVSFDTLLRIELVGHGAIDGTEEKVTLDGPSGVPLRSRTVQTFALALHELATNAVKYGALSGEHPDGRLVVRWHVEPGPDDTPSWLHVEWQESGVAMPHVNAPARGGGYGRELIERALPYQLRAKTSYELGADGVRCTISLPISGGG